MQTEQGLVPIEEVEVGDLVWASRPWKAWHPRHRVLGHRARLPTRRKVQRVGGRRRLELERRKVRCRRPGPGRGRRAVLRPGERRFGPGLLRRGVDLLERRTQHPSRALRPVLHRFERCAGLRRSEPALPRQRRRTPRPVPAPLRPALPAGLSTGSSLLPARRRLRVRPQCLGSRRGCVRRLRVQQRLRSGALLRLCVDPNLSAQCPADARGCCLPVCDTSAPDCPAAMECEAWLRRGAAHDVGVCRQVTP